MEKKNKLQHTNPRTEAESQQIVVQDYSHAYNTSFHLSRLQRISVSQQVSLRAHRLLTIEIHLQLLTWSGML